MENPVGRSQVDQTNRQVDQGADCQAYHVFQKTMNHDQRQYDSNLYMNLNYSSPEGHGHPERSQKVLALKTKNH